ncbi:MAG: hypothetical protein ABIR59_05055 [Gemmatimonadales bacterium]
MMRIAETPDVHERDAMLCRACGREERASEGYPCEGCGTFVCLVCTIRGVTLCRECRERDRTS